MNQQPIEEGLYWAKAYGLWYLVNYRPQPRDGYQTSLSLSAILQWPNNGSMYLTRVAPAAVTEWGERIHEPTPPHTSAVP